LISCTIGYIPGGCFPDFVILKTVTMVQKTYFKTKEYCKVKFSLQPESAASVRILGLNNDWEDAVEMKKKKDGSFSAEVKLPKESKHEFKYLVNESEWLNEPEADSEAPNEFGGTNSVISL
jgi:1,4-alpha-glucan branching enzyme